MSRPYMASNDCSNCHERDHVAWILESEKGVLECVVYRCMWCGCWEFVPADQDE